ncbi:MAG: glycosyltransferase [Planctomycetota bacterium]|nr:glycosyltransferase [Planctomycetota bacterium]MEC8512477.1 glycosyltransferase [Planctomycetota bacterium]
MTDPILHSERDPGATPARPGLVSDVDVTIVFPVQTHKAELENVIGALGGALTELGLTWECILVFDGIKGTLWERALELQRETRDQVRTIALHKPFGASVCLSSAFEHALGGLILTTPPYVQSDPVDLKKLFAAIDDGADFVTTWRSSRVDSKLNRVQSGAFNWVVRKVVGASFHDMNSTLRVMRREVLEQLTIYGSIYRYLPAVAYRQGFRVDEVPVRHLVEWGGAGIFGAGLYLRRALDLLGLMFLARFTHKPLRFFGALGGSLMLLGGLMAGTQFAMWLSSDMAFGLYQRSPFIVGVLLGVLGAQIVGFGLVGEIIVFTQAKNVREYRIERIYE